MFRSSVSGHGLVRLPDLEDADQTGVNDVEPKGILNAAVLPMSCSNQLLQSGFERRTVILFYWHCAGDHDQSVLLP